MSQSKTLIVAIILFLTLIGCKKKGCYGEKQKIECTTDIDPVCGCDGKSYNNKCEAQRAGVLNWEEGACN